LSHMNMVLEGGAFPLPGRDTHASRQDGRSAERSRSSTARLRNAIEHHELSLHHQPQYEIAGGQHCGVEALARWQLPSGESSLSYLSRLPVDRVKIDKSLIHRITTDAKTAAIVRAVISLGADLRFAVLAEGVESEKQLTRLRPHSFPAAQSVTGSSNVF
jgi:sensor c-di-GMP phosphodiesterase-like protein